MNLLHTKEELKELNTRQEYITELKALHKSFKQVSNLAGEILTNNNRINNELQKYQSLIGANVEYINLLGVAQQGKISSISHFLVDDIVVRIDYIRNGFDNVCLSKLKEIF